MTEEERNRIAYLTRGLRMYAQQVEAMLIPEHYEKAREAVAERGDEVVKVIREVQALLRKEGEK